MLIVHDPRCHNYSIEGHPENPARVSRTVELLRHQHDLAIRWETPLPIEESVILQAHSPELLQSLHVAEEPFDSDTPNYSGISEHAKRSAGAAVRAMNFARDSTPAFSLMRPPGHHATRGEMMGFCYLNSIAIATLEAVRLGEKKVAIFDFDVHHGNGTEAIVLNHPNIDFFSVHQYPCYPGTGKENEGSNCFNYPFAPHTERTAHRQLLERALSDLKRRNPGLIAVSAGFDAYRKDPLAHGKLEPEDYHWLGAELKRSGIPCFAILEGGYSRDLPVLIEAFLNGWDS